MQQSDSRHLGAAFCNQHRHRWQKWVVELLMQPLLPARLAQLGGGGREGKNLVTYTAGLAGRCARGLPRPPTCKAV
jgi:hypothetical protein